MAPLVSTVPIDPDVDDMETMIATTKNWANSQDGIRAKADNPDGYQNVITQMKERMAFLAQQQPPPPAQKPPSEAINFKDLAGMPSAQTQMAGQAGIKLDPNEIAAKQVADQQQKAQELEAKKNSGAPPTQDSGGK